MLITLGPTESAKLTLIYQKHQRQKKSLACAIDQVPMVELLLTLGNAVTVGPSFPPALSLE